MELYLYSFLGLMILTTIILKGIFCWMDCSSAQASRHVSNFIEKQKKELSASKSKLVHMEIPMEDIDIERTSTPVPMEEKKKHQQQQLYQSDV